MAKLSLAKLSLRRTVRSTLLALLALAGAGGALVRADAAERAVSVGEVSSRVARADLDLEGMLRSSIDAQLREASGVIGRPGKPVVLSLSLVRLESDAATRSLTASVSLAVRSARSGGMTAIIEGRARVGLESSRALTMERRAIDAAVHAALVRLPEALR